MKKTILFLALVCFITTAIATKTSLFNFNKSTDLELVNEKYKACIAACNACIISCGNCEKECSKEKDPKMDRCIQLCKECISVCTTASQLMVLNSAHAKEMCVLCAKICEECASECEKFDMDHCKKCAIDCRKTAKLCKEMQ